ASWIWPGHRHEDRRNVYADFRYDFQVKRNRGPAGLAITADQSYMLYFNGEYVGRGPARAVPKTVCCDLTGVIGCFSTGAICIGKAIRPC
ncbi:MAG: hypothetical protein WC567_08260, partial [Kiritimatiellia bacterium]